MGDFRLTPAQLSLLTVPGKEQENLATLREYGGGTGICEKLLSDSQNGISGASHDIISRREVYGENVAREVPLESALHLCLLSLACLILLFPIVAGWFSLFFGCFTDPILIILLIAAVVSLIVNSIQDPHEVRCFFFT